VNIEGASVLQISNALCKGKGPLYMFQGFSRTSSFSMAFNPTTIVLLKKV